MHFLKSNNLDHLLFNNYYNECFQNLLKNEFLQKIIIPIIIITIYMIQNTN